MFAGQTVTGKIESLVVRGAQLTDVRASDVQVLGGFRLKVFFKVLTANGVNLTIFRVISLGVWFLSR